MRENVSIKGEFYACADCRDRVGWRWCRCRGDVGAGRVDQGCVEIDFFLDIRVEVIRRHDHGIDEKRSDPLPHLGRLQRFDGLAVQPVDDVAWRLCRDKQSVPDRVFRVFKASLLRRRNARQAGVRLVPFTTSAVSLPSRTCGSTSAGGPKARLAVRSGSASERPRASSMVGRCQAAVVLGGLGLQPGG